MAVDSKTHWSLDPHSGVATCDMPLSGAAQGWRAAITLATSGSELLVSSFSIFSDPGMPTPQQGVTARLLRSVRLGELLEEAHRHLTTMADHKREVLVKDATVFVGAAGLREPTLADLFPTIEDLGSATPLRPGRGSKADVAYALWAARYVERKALSRKPIADLASRYGMKPGQVRDLVHEARRRGMLTETRQGAAGGGLTPRATALLSRIETDGPTA